MERTNHESATDHAINRRDAIKKGVVGAAAAGLVWSAPRVEGLSLRPSYAAAQSSTPLTATLLFDFSNMAPGFGPSTNVMCGDGSFIAAGDLTPFSVLSGTWAFIGGATGMITSVDGVSPVSPAVDWSGEISLAGNWVLEPSSFDASPGPKVTVTLKFNCS